jgi:4-hydroxythreonine-4-phosphate dehydrogenase
LPPIVSTRPLAVTMGDPAGIGPELTVRAWIARDRLRLPPFAVFAAPEVISAAAWRIGADVPLAPITCVADACETFHRRLPVVPIELAAPAVPGRPEPANAPAIIAAIREATAAAIGGEAEAVVTQPIAKSVLTAAGFPHPGHTEFLAALANEARPERIWHPVMMLAAEVLRVVPATIHIPLSAVPAALSEDLVARTVHITAEALRSDFGTATPRIAVTGLNPHAGESGTIGTEERDVIAPAIARLAEEGLRVTGPHSADSLFHAAARRTYDAVVTMYHDQALIPIKTLAFEDAVNVTLGLPFVRTSPDHGTAFDIAARGTADPASFIAALKLGSELGRRRRSA